MSRSKKSRKPGVGSSGVKKDTTTRSTTKDVVAPVDKKTKKLKGKPAGNRQNEAKPLVDIQQSKVKKDPRIGNKTPIVLSKPAGKKPVAAQNKAKSATPIVAQSKNKAKPATSSVAPIRTIEPEHIIDTDALMQELEAIEQNERLISILSKQDEEVELTESEVDFFNEQMDKHQSIRETLGLDDEDEDEEELEDETVSAASSEDDLWDKFDNNDLSKFE